MGAGGRRGSRTREEPEDEPRPYVETYLTPSTRPVMSKSVSQSQSATLIKSIYLSDLGTRGSRDCVMVRNRVL